MMKILTVLLLAFTGFSTALAQTIVDKRSFNAALKTLQANTSVPLKIPTYFVVPSYLTAKERKLPLKTLVAVKDKDSYALAFCYTGVCQGSYNYGEVTGEKITGKTEKFVFDKTVKLTKGITG